MIAVAIGSVGIMGAMSAHAVAVGNVASMNITEIGAASGTLGSSGASTTAGTFYFQNISGTQPVGGTVGYNFSSVGTPSGNIISTASQPDGAFATPFMYGGTTAGQNFFANTCGSVKTPCHASPAGSQANGGLSANYLGAGTNVSTIDLTNWGGFYAGTGSQFTLSPSMTSLTYNQPLTFTTSALGAGGLAATQFYYTLDWSHQITAAENAGFAGSNAVWHLEGVGVAAVPEASTYGMMLSGLGLVGVAIRRRKQV